MATHSLGEFDFVNFHRPGSPAAGPLLLQEQTSITHRAGVDGTGVYLLGKKAAPFPMRSFVDVAADDDAVTLLTGYHDLIGTAGLRLVWNDLDYEAEFSVLYIPLAVSDHRILRLTASVGGLNVGSTTAVEAIWTLLPIQAD